MRHTWEQPEYELPFDDGATNGIRQFYSKRADGGIQLRQEIKHDLASLEASKALAKNDEHWKSGVKNGWLHYAHIDDALLFRWHLMGVNINEPKELLAMVNQPEWSYLRCTGKVHT